LTANRSKNGGLIKAGESITFVPKDSKLEEGCEVLIGHPIFDDEMDENIVVRAVMDKSKTIQDMMKLMEVPKFTATVQAYRILSGIPVAYVKDVAPLVQVVDAAGHPSNKSELDEALKAGCGRCKKSVTSEQIKGKGIARRKQDGAWRIVCAECLDASITAVKERKPDVVLRARVQ
jgi:hypothetical protein